MLWSTIGCDIQVEWKEGREGVKEEGRNRRKEKKRKQIVEVMWEIAGEIESGR